MKAAKKIKINVEKMLNSTIGQATNAIYSRAFIAILVACSHGTPILHALWHGALCLTTDVKKQGRYNAALHASPHTTSLVACTGTETTNHKIKANLSGSQHKGHSQHLQYSDSKQSSAKDLSFPLIKNAVHHKAHVSAHDCTTRPKPNVCCIPKEMVDNIVSPAWIPIQRRSVVIQQMVASQHQLFNQLHLPNI